MINYPSVYPLTSRKYITSKDPIHSMKAITKQIEQIYGQEVIKERLLEQEQDRCKLEYDRLNDVILTKQNSHKSQFDIQYMLSLHRR